MSKELTPRTQAIRKNIIYLDQHIQEFIDACTNIRDALDTLEDALLLQKVFIQMINSLHKLSLQTQAHAESIMGETEELIAITRIDNNINSHLRHIEQLIQGVQKIFNTTRLGQAVGFALIEQEIHRIRRTRKNAMEIYYTIQAHYSDTEGKITSFLERSSQKHNHKILSKNTRNLLS